MREKKVYILLLDHFAQHGKQIWLRIKERTFGNVAQFNTAVIKVIKLSFLPSITVQLFTDLQNTYTKGSDISLKSL